MSRIPDIPLLSSARAIPAIGLGTASSSFPEDGVATKVAVLEAIRIGYRHFDTAAAYGSEKSLGEAIAEAIDLGLIESRDDLFITSKLWCNAAEGGLVLPAIKKSLENLGLDYLDLYLIHWPIKLNPDEIRIPIPIESVSAINIKSVWEGMEECQNLGLTKAIGVSNFSSRRLREILYFAKITPAVNQVEMNPIWQQKELNDFCKDRGIVITAYSPLGAAGTPWGDDRVMQSSVLHDIAKSKRKTVAQVSLRWLLEQGVTIVVKSFNKERMEENLDIFDWSLSVEESEMIGRLLQKKACIFSAMVTEPNDIVKELDAELLRV